MAASSGPSEIVRVDKESEYRLEAGDTAVTVTVRDGAAEVFGSELSRNGAYTFAPHTKTAVYTWTGATLQVDGEPESGYVAGDTPMPTYANVHGSLQLLRDAARADEASSSGLRGPVVVLAGPTDVGKSSLGKILANYAVRDGGTPLYVDLDVGQGGVSVPGVVGAVVLARPFEVEVGEPDGTSPLLYFFGHSSPGANAALFEQIVDKLAAEASELFEENDDIRASGAIINTCGWVDGGGVPLLVSSIRSFAADVVIVLDNDRLAQQLTKEFAGTAGTTVVKLAKSGGVVTRNPAFRRSSRSRSIHHYFYGPHGDLTPSSRTLYFRDIQMFRVGTAELIPEAALPEGAAPEKERVLVSSVFPSKDLVNCILAISYAQTEDELLDANIAGFVHVTDVEVDKAKMRVLAPSAGQLPGSGLLLVSDIKWYVD